MVKRFLLGLIILFLAFGFCFDVDLCLADDSDTWYTYVAGDLIDPDEVNPMFTHMTGNWCPRESAGTRSTREVFNLGSQTYKWHDLFLAGSFEATSGEVTGSLTIEGNLLVGANANIGSSDYENAQAVFSKDDVGDYNANYRSGVAAESAADGSYGAYALVGIGKTSSSYVGGGIYARSVANATGDTTPAIGGAFVSSSTHAGGNNNAIWAEAENGANNHSFYGYSGDLYNADDIYTVAWTDYASSSTVTGWSSFTTKVIRYKKIGDTVFVNFKISGVSNAPTVSFTLPYTSANFSGEETTVALGQTGNNSGWAAAGLALLGANSATVNCYQSAAGAWTASGNKWVVGQFFYQAQ